MKCIHKRQQIDDLSAYCIRIQQNRDTVALFCQFKVTLLNNTALILQRFQGLLKALEEVCWAVSERERESVCVRV